MANRLTHIPVAAPAKAADKLREASKDARSQCRSISGSSAVCGELTATGLLTILRNFPA